jgi:hypothetical protein
MTKIFKKPIYATHRFPTTITIALVIILVLSALTISIPNANAKTSIRMSFAANGGAAGNGRVGQNTPTHMSWRPTPNLFATDPAYAGKTSVWPDAVVTFIRPDGTTDVINGPLPMRPYTFQGFTMDILMEYTPNMMGTWKVNLYWPGDDTYDALNQTDTFDVGEHFGLRTVWAMLSLKPYPAVGLGQNLLINAWVTPAPLSFRDVYEGYMFTFTGPSGTSFKVGPITSEMPGTVWFDLPLTEIGTWSIKFDFPGDYLDKPATVTRTITVQKDPVPIGYPDTALPTQAWTYPINVENREWRNIAGPWYMTYYNVSGGSWNPYTEAPRTAHILWQLPAYSQIGGFIGAPHSVQTGGGEAEYGAGDVGMYTASVPVINTIMAGRGYYSAGGNIHCIDIKTGAELWSVPGSFNVGTERGRTAALYSFSSSRFIAYDAISGATILNVTGITMSRWLDPYVITSSGGRLIKWDTSSSATNFADRIVFNVSVPKAPSTYSTVESNLWFSASGDYAYAYNLTTGALEYNNTISHAGDPNTWIYLEGPATGGGYGLAYQSAVPYQNDGIGYAAYDVLQGKLAWYSEKTDYPWGNFWAYNPQASGDGMVIGLGYSGVYGFNATNGKIVWHFIDNDTYFEEPYSSNINEQTGEPYASYSFGSIGPVIGAGVVYAANTEHSPTFIYRGQGLCAIDAFTGELLWKIKGAYSPNSIAYGTLVASDSYNGFTYGFGKGTTTMTLTTQNDVVTKGNSILLKGTVADTSAAQNGTAAISDESMTAWMEYLHMQQPKPTNATGVQIHLTALDANGNIEEIGTTTSDMNGIYKIGWTPPIEGEYTIYANFEGSESYYGSQAETVLLVSTAATSASPSIAPTQTPQIENPTPTPSLPPQTNQPTTSPTSAVEPPTYGETTTTYIAIAAAVIGIIAAATALVLRKKRKP